MIALTGGGSTAISRLLGVPGASRTVIEATIPYDGRALARYIGGEPDRACSGKTARAMAMAAFQRARQFSDGEAVFGIGCTAALQTDRVRRGSDRCYVATQSLTLTEEYGLELAPTRDRESQEQACGELVIRTIAEAFGLSVSTPPWRDGESLHVDRVHGEASWQTLHGGALASTNQAIKRPGLVFPGAFNPLHQGHRQMIEVARSLVPGPVLLEISAFNVDKPPLDYLEMRARAAGVAGEFPLTFTNAATFVEKSALFNGAIFMVGSDTLERIGEPRYYQNSVPLRDLALSRLAASDIQFLVFGRKTADRFIGLDEIEIPPVLRRLCQGVPEARFRVDISSSALRQRALREPDGSP